MPQFVKLNQMPLVRNNYTERFEYSEVGEPREININIKFITGFSPCGKGSIVYVHEHSNIPCLRDVLEKKGTSIRVFETTEEINKLITGE
jgi:hypothetical protein